VDRRGRHRRPLTELKRLATKITTVPEGFKVHSLVEKVWTTAPPWAVAK
jgi:2-oxoglutarate dehydrogenase complex dehydrogenase (E1) component-like enzyme